MKYTVITSHGQGSNRGFRSAVQAWAYYQEAKKLYGRVELHFYGMTMLYPDDYALPEHRKNAAYARKRFEKEIEQQTKRSAGK